MRVAVAGLFALATAMGIGRFAFTPLMPIMQAEGTISLVQGGWLASANYAGYLVGALTAVAIRLRPVAMLRFALSLVALATLAMAWNAGIAIGLALRFVAGVASAWVLVSTSAWCLQHFEREPGATRPRLAAILYAGVGLGILAAGLACLGLASLGARAGWLALGSAAAVTTFALAITMRDEGAGPTAAKAPAMRWDATAWRLVIAYGIFGFGYIIPATYLPAMAREILPDPAIYGWSWPVFGAAAAASVFVAAAVRRRASDRAIWIGGHVLMAAGVALPLAVHGLAGLVAAGVLVGGTFMVATMAGMQEARRVRGAAARPLMAAMTSSFAAGQIAGPLLVSALAARGAGFGSALLIAAAGLVGSCFLLPRPESPPMTERMPPLDAAAMDDAQRAAAQALIAGPRKAVVGPFIALLRSPELLDRMQRVGEYLRFETSVAQRLNEWAILVVSRHWTNQFEWAVHHPLAIKAGVAPAAIDALAARREPAPLAEDEALVYAFTTELLGTHRVADATYARAVALLGERGVVDLLGTIGYFSALDLLMNAVGTPPPANGVAPLAG